MPRSSSRDRSLRQAVARARMFLRDRMGWIHGCPVGQHHDTVEWLQVPSDRHDPFGCVTLTREHLRLATSGFQKLRHRFPRALPLAVADYDAWIRGVPVILEHLKQAIHHQVPLPSFLSTDHTFGVSAEQQAQALSAASVPVGRMIAALSWMYQVHPDEFRSGIKWISNAQPVLATLLQSGDERETLSWALGLYEIVRRDGTAAVQPLLQWLADERVFSVSICPHDDVLQNIQRVRHQRRTATSVPVTSPSPRPGPWLLNECLKLLPQPDSVRRRALQLLPLFYPTELLDEWQIWWTAQRRLEMTAGQLPHIRSRSAAAALMAQLGEQAVFLKQTKPRSSEKMVKSSELLQAVDAGHTDWHAGIVKLLRSVPSAARERLFRSFLQYRDERNVRALLTLLVRRLRDQPPRLAPWQSEAASLPLFEVRGLSRPSLVPGLVETFERLANGETTNLCPRASALLTQLYQATEDPAAAAACFTELHEAGRTDGWYHRDTLRSAWQLLQGQPGLARVISQLEELDDELDQTCVSLNKHLQQLGWGALCTQQLLDRQWKSLQPLLIRWRCLDTGDGPLPELPRPQEISEVPIWAERYPLKLHEDLRRLAAVAPQAEVIAQKTLKRNFPDQTALVRERDSIQQQLQQSGDRPGLQARLQSLQSRIATVPKVSAGRLATLQQKIQDHVRRQSVKRIHQAIEQAARCRTCEALQVSRLDDERDTVLLSAMQQLEPEFRQLGVRLLRSWRGDRSWDPNEEPANRSFQRRMRGQGIKLQPWLKPAEPRLIVADSGQSLLVGLETSPVEILHMGGYFRTCLSPGRFNFFSAVANAVDCNKQVLFARDTEGQVRGRCLVAITDRGHLLGFHPYAHDATLKWGQIVAEFLADLSRQMNTAVVPHGTIEPLLVSNWYDDGPVDICGRLQFLAPESEFRREWPDLSPEQFVARLESLLDPLPINELTLPWVLEVDDLRKRPELLLPLFPRIAAMRGLSAEVRAECGVLAWQAGAVNHARPLLMRWARQQQKTSWYRCDVQERTARAVAALNPSEALRLLRQTRHQSEAKDNQETVGWRRRLLVELHEQLGRVQLAASLRTKWSLSSELTTGSSGNVVDS